ncbi:MULTISPECIES: hypothetical protein [Streptomyces]|uniref:Ig-like domain-containing protein n=1 Tax=Streptomyces luteosporeus TaxID=173856 RepID=A0ABP6G6U1_9ACTN
MRHLRCLTMAAAALLAVGSTTAAARVQEGAVPAHQRARVMAQHTVHVGPTVDVPAGQAVVAPPAVCPAGQVASGGGGEITGGSVFLTWSRPRPGTSDTWEVRGLNTGGPTAQLHAEVVCTTAPHGRGTADVSVLPGNGEAAIAPCPAGQVPSGGGYDVTGDSLRVTVVDVQSTSWLAAASNTGSDAQKLTSYAVCSPAAHSHPRSGSLSVPAGQTVEATASCPAGQVVTGGGGAAGFTTFVRASLPSGNGWKFRVTNTSPDLSDVMNAEADCTVP